MLIKMVIFIFISCDCGSPGSAHHTTVFKHTQLYREFITNTNSLTKTNMNHLIRDSGFLLTPNLLVPFKDYGYLPDIHSTYNKHLSHTRFVIEHAFVLFKGRYKTLKYLGVEYQRSPT